MATLTIGSLTKCMDCGRRRREPGADYCPDCTLMRRLHKEMAYELEMLVEQFDPDRPTLYLYPKLRDDPGFLTFATVADFVHTANDWRDRNPGLLREYDGRRCPHCGERLDD